MSGGGILSMEDQKALASIDGLPKSLKDIGETLGLAVLLRLVQEYGGTRVYVLGDFKEGNEFVKRMGEEHAKALIGHCGGEYLQVPRSLVSRDCRDEMVLVLAKKGETQQNIALSSNCTQRTVYNILKRKGALKKKSDDRRQIDMFGKA